MSLVAYNRSNSWSVVLRDESKKTLVLYDRSSNQISLIADPVLYNRFVSEVVEENGSQQSSTLTYSAGPQICSSCGQYIHHDIHHDTSHESRSEGHFYHHGEFPEFVNLRDSNYFKLLESYVAEPSITLDQPIYSSISESSFSQGYFKKFFETKALLGRGSRGAVYLVEHILDNVSLGLFALKKVPVGNDHAWLEKVLAEVHLLRLLTHPNLVGYNHVWLENSSLTNFGPAVPCAFILEEYCDGGTVEDFMKNRLYETESNVSGENSNNNRGDRRKSLVSKLTEDQKHTLETSKILSLKEILSFMRDITKGVVHLHLNQIVHRDLKPSNCLLCNTKSQDDIPTVLVSDFGEGQLEGLTRSESGSTGTLEYCAPELVKPVQGRLAQFCKKTDIFSLGMILYYLCFAKLPYTKSVWDEERQDIDCLMQEVQSFNGFDYESVRNLRQDLTPEIYSLLSRMLSVNPTERPSAGEVLLCLSGSSTASSLSQKSPEQLKSTRSIPTIGVREKAMKAAGSLISGIIVVKCMFLLIKAMTLMKLESESLVFQMLLFLAGIEVPLMSLRLITALFAIHCYILFLVSLRGLFF